MILCVASRQPSVVALFCGPKSCMVLGIRKPDNQVPGSTWSTKTWANLNTVLSDFTEVLDKLHFCQVTGVKRRLVLVLYFESNDVIFHANSFLPVFTRDHKVLPVLQSTSVVPVYLKEAYIASYHLHIIVATNVFDTKWYAIIIHIISQGRG